MCLIHVRLQGTEQSSEFGVGTPDVRSKPLDRSLSVVDKDVLEEADNQGRPWG